MAKNIFTAEMEDYLLRSIRNGEDGNIYRCLVLKSDNQKIKVRDAWTWVQNNFNLRFGTQLSKEILRKKFYYLRSKTRAKAVSDREQEVKKTAKTFAEFRRVNNQTGGGPGIDPPDEDGDAQPREDHLPIDVEDSLKVFYTVTYYINGSVILEHLGLKTCGFLFLFCFIKSFELS